MTTPKMHKDEIDIDADLVRLLIAGQFPQWSKLALEHMSCAGTDNAMFRLGSDMAVRLPRHPRAARMMVKEQHWLPRIAPHLPLAIPVPLAQGVATDIYPFRWSVCPWLEGDNPTPDAMSDPCGMAHDLVGFILALRRIDTDGAPSPGVHNFWRGVPLAMRDRHTREAIEQAKTVFDAGTVTAAWEADLQTPPWQGSPVWIHGDLSAGNLLVREDRLSAVIDFGGLGVGDPACDLVVAWGLFAGRVRTAFRDALGVDAATWRRGRGWALSTAIIGVAYYQDSNASLAAASRSTIRAVLTDFGR